MAGICTNSIRKGGATCDHRIVSVTLDGELFDLHTMEAEIDAMPWTEAEKRQFILLGLKRQRVQGVTLDAAIGRVINGDEATNVKTFPILTKDVAKTNIPATYTNVLIGLNGERVDVDFTGFTQFKLVCRFNLLGTGTHNWRVVDDALITNVLYESAANTVAGEKENNSGWVNLPTWATGEKAMRLQAKSTLNTDDPVYRGCTLYLK